MTTADVIWTLNNLRRYNASLDRLDRDALAIAVEVLGRVEGTLERPGLKRNVQIETPDFAPTNVVGDGHDA